VRPVALPAFVFSPRAAQWRRAEKKSNPPNPSVNIMTAIRKYSDVLLVECFDYNTVSSPMLYKAINEWRKIRRFRIRTHRRHDKTLAARIKAAVWQPLFLFRLRGYAATRRTP